MGWGKWSRSQKKAATLVIIFILIFCIQNIVYIKQDGFRTTDFQMGNAIDYYIYLFSNPNITSSITYPPLTYLVTLPYFLTMGISQHTARLSLMIFWIIFLLAMFGIGRHYGGYYSGFTVMALSASSPHVLEYSRIYFVDFPQVATTALAFFLLLKTEKFQNRLYSILFGFGMAFTMMAKWSAIFFMIIPIIWLVIPIIFKSKKAIMAFVIFLLTFLVSVAGTFLYYKLNIRFNIDRNYWFANFLLSIIIPTGLNLYLSRKLDRDFGKDDGYAFSPERKIINFNFSTIPVMFFSGAWFSWAGKAISSRYLMERHDIKKFEAVYRRIFEYASAMKTLFSFAVILFAIGIFFMIIKKRKDMFVLILTSLVAFELIFELATYDIDPTRYIFGIIIFLAVICGFWVQYTGRAKGYITAGMVLLSLFSILAWTVIPGDLSIYYPVQFRLILPMETFPMKVLCTEPPNPTFIDFREVIRNMKPEDYNHEQYSYYLLFTSRLGQRPSMTIWEKLNLDIFKYGKRMGAMNAEFNDYSDPLTPFIPNMLERLNTQNVLLVSENGSAPEHLIKQIKYHVKLKDKIRKINVGGKYWITLLIIEHSDMMEQAPESWPPGPTPPKKKKIHKIKE